MVNKLIDGAWKKAETDKYVCIGFQYGGHTGGECEILLPKQMLTKFVSDQEWAWKTMNRFGRIVYLASPDMDVPIPKNERRKDGVVPMDWS